MNKNTFSGFPSGGGGEVIDNLNSTAPDKALSANQGLVLNEKVENIKLKFIVEEGF